MSARYFSAKSGFKIKKLLPRFKICDIFLCIYLYLFANNFRSSLAMWTNKPSHWRKWYTGHNDMSFKWVCAFFRSEISLRNKKEHNCAWKFACIFYIHLYLFTHKFCSSWARNTNKPSRCNFDCTWHDDISLKYVRALFWYEISSQKYKHQQTSYSLWIMLYLFLIAVATLTLVLL